MLNGRLETVGSGCEWNTYVGVDGGDGATVEVVMEACPIQPVRNKIFVSPGDNCHAPFMVNGNSKTVVSCPCENNALNCRSVVSSRAARRSTSYG